MSAADEKSWTIEYMRGLADGLESASKMQWKTGHAPTPEILGFSLELRKRIHDTVYGIAERSKQ